MTLRQWLEYDAWATRKLLEAVAPLEGEAFTREIGAPPTSIRGQFVHLLSVADRYRARLAGETVPDVSFEDFAHPRDLIAYESRVRGRLDAFLAALDESDFEREVEHHTRSGVFRATVASTLLHVCNHATYHRGQIAALLKMQNRDFPDTDLIIWQNRP